MRLGAGQGSAVAVAGADDRGSPSWPGSSNQCDSSLAIRTHVSSSVRPVRRAPRTEFKAGSPSHCRRQRGHPLLSSLRDQSSVRSMGPADAARENKCLLMLCANRFHLLMLCPTLPIDRGFFCYNSGETCRSFAAVCFNPLLIGASFVTVDPTGNHLAA